MWCRPDCGHDLAIAPMASLWSHPCGLPAWRRVMRVAGVMRIAGVVGFLVATAGVAPTGPPAAHAQGLGLFETLFGQRTRSPSSPGLADPASRTGAQEPRLRITVVPRRPAAPAAFGYCVRLCDGRYFPLPRLASPRASAEALCRSLCPGSPTALFLGPSIESAIDAQQVRYTKLRTAFEYRKSVMADCTCNGVDQFGTAAISLYQDITLLPGDIVATSDGMRVFTGSRASDHRPEQFIALDDYPRLSLQDRGHLAGLRIASGTTTAPVGPEQMPEPLTVRTRIVVGFEALNAPPATPRVIRLER